MFLETSKCQDGRTLGQDVTPDMKEEF